MDDASPPADVMDEDWSLLVSLLPTGWEQLAVSTRALKGLRKDKGAESFLRVLLLHLACGYSLRETVARAKEAKLAEMSDVALLKRLRKSKDWLQALCHGLLAESAALTRRLDGLNLRLVDATRIEEPGPTGSAWRIHYSLQWPQLTCDHFELTGVKGAGTGESLCHFPVRQEDHLVADRGYCAYSSVAHVAATGGTLTVRLNPNAVRLIDAHEKLFPLDQRLRGVRRVGEIGCWSVSVTNAVGDPPVRGRLCVVRKSQTAIAQAQAKAKRDAADGGYKIKPQTLFHAEYVMVFTTAAKSLSAQAILEIYRLRWQIELVFKRFKQLARLGHLPKTDDSSAKAWLYGKLFVALLAERLIQHAESFSPWGYDVAPAAMRESMAGV